MLCWAILIVIQNISSDISSFHNKRILKLYKVIVLVQITAYIMDLIVDICQGCFEIVFQIPLAQIFF